MEVCLTCPRAENGISITPIFFVPAVTTDAEFVLNEAKLHLFSHLILRP